MLEPSQQMFHAVFDGMKREAEERAQQRACEEGR